MFLCAFCVFQTVPDDNKKTLKCIVKEPVEIAYIVLDKNRLDSDRQFQKQNIYNVITGHLMRCLPFENNTHSKLIVDKRSCSRIIRSDFDQYVKEKAAFQLDITHENSEYNKCLQATDFIAGAIYRKYESGDDRFYNLIQDRITVAEHLL